MRIKPALRQCSQRQGGGWSLDPPHHRQRSSAPIRQSAFDPLHSIDEEAEAGQRLGVALAAVECGMAEPPDAPYLMPQEFGTA